MIPLIKWELRQRKTAIVWWTLASVVLVTTLLLIYPSIHSQSQQFNKVINQLPAGLRQLKTGTSGAVDVGSPIGFLNSQVFYATLPLFFIILAITRCAALIGRDEADHTIELLLARPLSRGRLLLGKALSGTSELLIVGGATTIIMLLLDHVSKLDVSIGRLLLTTVYTVLFSLSFGAVAFSMTAFGRLTKRASTAIAALISLGGYLLTTLGGLTHFLQIPAKFAPYHYFAPDKILYGQSVTGLNIYLVSVFVLTAALAYGGFRRRDIE
jgi:ABC-2 type transport system permease protein